jgi:hypothetical protein
MSLLLTVMSFTKTPSLEDDPVPARCTKIMLAGLGPSMLFFGGWSYWQLTYYMKRITSSFRQALYMLEPNIECCNSGMFLSCCCWLSFFADLALQLMLIPAVGSLPLLVTAMHTLYCSSCQ